MTRTQSLIAQSIILLLCVAYSLFLNPQLPATVPTHWDIQGHIDGYGPKWVSLWLMPGTVLFIVVMTVAVPYLSPKKFEVDRFASTFGVAMLLVTFLMAALHYVILNATLHGATPSEAAKADVTKPLMVILFLFFAAIGNLMGKVKQNFFMGIRTPWTLADERVWNKTHREAGVLWLIGGIVGAVLAALGVPMLITISLLILITLAPVVRSFMIYKQLNPTQPTS